jgi:hypothetical protein
LYWDQNSPNCTFTISATSSSSGSNAFCPFSNECTVSLPITGGSGSYTVSSNISGCWVLPNSNPPSWVGTGVNDNYGYLTPSEFTYDATANTTSSSQSTSLSFTGETNSGSVMITFDEAGPPPVSLNCTSTTGPQEVFFAWSTTCTASSGTPPYTFSTSGLPSGFTANNSAASTTVSGFTSTAGAYNFTVTVTDANSTTASQTFIGTVAANPNISSCAWTISIYAVAGTPYTSPSCTITGGVPPFHAVNTTSLPSGLSLNFTNANTFQLTGTPAAMPSFDVTVTVEDSLGASPFVELAGNIPSQAFSINCTENAGSSGPPTVGSLFSETCTSAGGTPPYSWSISTGALPAGVSLTTANGWCITGASTPDCGATVTRYIAAPFTPSSSFTVSGLSLLLGYVGGTNGVVINLMSNSAGVPGTVLESWSASNLASGPNTISVSSKLNPTLSAGQTYWVEVTPAAADTTAFWYTNNLSLGGGVTDISGAGWTALSGYAGQTLPAFSVSSTASGGYSDLGTNGAVSGASVVLIGTPTAANYGQSYSFNVQAADTSYQQQTLAAFFGGTFPTQVTIQTSPTGLQFIADGTAAQTAPQTLSLGAGFHTIAVNSPQPGAAGTQYAFVNWSDGGAQSHSITVGSTPVTYTATFQTQYQLTMAASPSGCGTVSPASGTYENAGSVVPVSITLNSGYYFIGWTGSVASGSATSTTTTVNAAEGLTANCILTPAITSLSPSTVNAGSAAFTLTVYGSNFVSGAVVDWNGSPLTTTFVNASQLTAAVPANLAALGGTANITVVLYGGTFSGSPALIVYPMVSSESPNGGQAGEAGFTLTVNGVGFSPGASVLFNGSALTTTYINSTQLTATVRASALTVAGMIPVSVISGGVTATASSIFYLGPTTTSVSPATVTAGGPQFTLTVNGTGFSSGASVLWSTSGPTSTALPTTFVSNTQLTATVAAGLIASPGTADILVTSNLTSVIPSTVTINPATSLVTIQTNPTGLQFSVDGGTAQTAPQNLSLTLGSHMIAVATTQAGAAGTQYAFANWSDGLAASHSITVGASGGTYTATFQTQYLLTISASPTSAGTVTPASGTYYNSGSVVPIGATANSGFTFANWIGSAANANAASTTVTMSAPQTLTAAFAAPVTIQTNPSGLQFTVNGGTALTAPQTLNLPGGSTIAVAPTQAGTAGTQYVFSSWNFGNPASSFVILLPAPATYTASFQTQYQLTVTDSPANGGTVQLSPASASGYYNAGTSVQLTASAASGSQFINWSGALSGSANPQNLAMSAPESVAALFGTPNTITTSPPGLQIIIDGQTLTAPQTPDWVTGSTHSIGVVTPQATGQGSQLAFGSWSDSGAATHNVTAQANGTYTATFQTQYLLSESVSPAFAGAISPAAGYFNAGSAVQLSAAPSPGYAFNSWGGALTGSSTPQTVTMSGPQSVSASFTVPGTLTVSSGWRQAVPVYSGPVNYMAVDAGGTAYAATPSGIFSSSNAGQAWTSATGDLPVLSIQALAADPVTPGTLYAGTNQALYKTVNSGVHWSALAIPAGTSISQIAVAKSNPSYVYVSTANAYVYRSTDGGNTWTQSSSGLAGGSSGPSDTTAIAVDPTNPLRVYTATWRGEMFGSTDGGNSWQALGGGSTYWISHLAIAPSAPNVIWAVNDAEYTSFGNILMSNNYGSTWTNEGQPAGPEDGAAITVDSSNSSLVYVATSQGLYKTTGGGTWTLLFAPGSGPTALNAFAINPLNTAQFFTGSSFSGPYVSANSGSTWQQNASGFAAASISAIDLPPSAPSTIYAAANTAGLLKSANGGSTWVPLGTPESFASLPMGGLSVNPSNPNQVVVNAGSNVWESNDGGNTFSAVAAYTPYWIRFNPAAPADVTASIADWQGGFLFSGNGGSSWSIPQNIYIYPTNYIFHPSYANVVLTPANQYTGASMTTSYIMWSNSSGDGGWQQSAEMGQGGLNEAALDQNNPGTLYVVGSLPSEGTQGVYQFAVTYSGASIGGISRVPGTFNNGLGTAVPRRIVYNKATSTLYLTTDHGVFYSTDQASNWLPMNTGLPYLSTDPLAVTPDGAHVIVGTNGGVWIHDSLAITTTTLANAETNVGFSQTLAASGGTPTYGWALPPGSLPTGMNFSAQGVLSGTPTVSGTYNITVTVMDSFGAATSASYQLIVSSALAIATTSLPPFQVNAPYSQTLSASGGWPPYTWSVTGLPSTVTLASGQLTGTPTATGSYNLTECVTDSLGVSVCAPTFMVSSTWAYLVGDVYPFTSDSAPNFGQWNPRTGFPGVAPAQALTIQDVIAIVLAANNISTPEYTRPVAGTDRFDAMDTFPKDTSAGPGGDGCIDIHDIVVELFRFNNLDLSRPIRSSPAVAKTCPNNSRTSPTALAQDRSGVTTPSKASDPDGTLVFGDLTRSGGDEERMPVYLNAVYGLSRVALTFGLGDERSPLRFVATREHPPSFAHDKSLGIVAVVWAEGLSVPAGDRILLGYIAGRVGALTNLRMYGWSASGLDDFREVVIDAPQTVGR